VTVCLRHVCYKSSMPLFVSHMSEWTGSIAFCPRRQRKACQTRYLTRKSASKTAHALLTWYKISCSAKKMMWELFSLKAPCLASPNPLQEMFQKTPKQAATPCEHCHLICHPRPFQRPSLLKLKLMQVIGRRNKSKNGKPYSTIFHRNCTSIS
jgi:hypothetical protein